MSYTLIEWAKLNNNPLQSGVVEVFARTNPVLERITFKSIAGNAYTFNREKTLPGVEWRGLYQAYTESTGEVEKVTEDLFMLGGDIDFDTFLVATGTGENNDRAVQTELKSKAMAQAMMHAFIRGDTSTTPTAPTGLNKKLSGTGQEMILGANGAALTLDALDEAIDAVYGRPGLIVMNRAMRRMVNKLVRAAGHATEVVTDSFGRQLQAYAGIPIADIDDNAFGTALLPFNETQGTDLETTSIYLMSFGDDALHGIQSKPMDVRDLGEIDSKSVLRTRVDWFANPLVLRNKRAAVRIKGVKKPV